MDRDELARDLANTPMPKSEPETVTVHKSRSVGRTTINADGSPHDPISYDCAGCLTHAQLGGILRAAGLL